MIQTLRTDHLPLLLLIVFFHMICHLSIIIPVESVSKSFKLMKIIILSMVVGQNTPCEVLLFVNLPLYVRMYILLYKNTLLLLISLPKVLVIQLLIVVIHVVIYPILVLR